MNQWDDNEKWYEDFKWLKDSAIGLFVFAVVVAILVVMAMLTLEFFSIMGN